MFYLGYTLVTWLIVNAVDKFKRAKSFFFVLCCLICAVPFFYIRMRDLIPELPLAFALTGLAYNMLKAVDAVYFVHYTGERVPLITYANYMLFFPVITAGPILRYRDFSASLNKPMPITGESLTKNFKRLILGYFKKVVVMALVTELLTKLAIASPHIWWSVAACLVSYFLFWLDMSGYADIAIALGGFMGLKVPENFKKPLKAASMTQFWRNWHVSLTDWIREHIFVVLNGKRLTKYQGAMIGFGTMVVMGLWHGFTAALRHRGPLQRRHSRRRKPLRHHDGLAQGEEALPLLPPRRGGYALLRHHHLLHPGRHAACKHPARLRDAVRGWAE